MKIFDRYLVLELWGIFLLGVAGFIMVMTTDLIFTFVDMIINKGVPVIAVVKLILYKLPSIMVLTFPVAFLFAAAIVMGRMTKDRELTALRTSGISFFRITLPAIVMAGAICMSAFFINEWIAPAANKISDELIREVIYRQPLLTVKEQVFFKDNSNRFFYIRSVDKKNNSLEGIMIYDLGSGGLPRVITAKSATFSKDRWHLNGGTVHNYGADGRIGYEADFTGMDLYVSEDILNFASQKTTEEMNTAELGTLIDSFKKSGINTAALATDFYMKFSVPAVTFVFAVFILPLAVTGGKRGGSFGVVLSVAVMFTYYVAASIFRSMGRGGLISAPLAAWIPPLVLLAAGSFLYLKEAGR